MVKPREFKIGDQFHRWTITGDVFYKEDSNGRKHRFVECQCACGTTSILACQALTSPSRPTKSCGCLRSEVVAKARQTHGMRHHPAYSSWRAMKTRCTNQNARVYENYGAKGISYDDRWENFESFWEDMGPSWFEGSDIDRIDYRENYCLTNCRWADKSVSSHNKSKEDNCSSSYKGVYLDRESGKWVAKLTRDGVTLFHKRFILEEDAARAYDDVSQEIYGDRPNEKYFNLCGV